MKLTYLTKAIIPSYETHPYQIMKTCEGFAKNKVDIDLILYRRTHENKNIWHYYGIKNKFKIRKMPYLIWIDWYNTKLGFLRFLIQKSLFTIFFVLYSFFNKRDIYYTRDVFWAYFLSSLRFFHRGKVYFECHKPKPEVIELVKKEMLDGLIVTTNQLKNYYLERGVVEERLFVASNGVDLKMFENLPSKTAIRQELKIPLNKKIICYTGHLYDWKGAQILALAMKGFINDKVICYFVGGMEDDIERFKNFIKKNNIKNIIMVGYVPPILIPKYQKASDVLVIPNIKKGESGFTSPLKLYEYMAAKKPIVASDLPSIRETLNEDKSVLVEPSDPKALESGIKLLLSDKKLAEKMSKNAYRSIRKYDWEERAKNIINFMSQKT